MSPASRRWAALLTAALLLAVAAGLVWRHRTGPKHLRTVTPGVLYRSGALRPANLIAVVERHGIRTIVNLRSEAENAGAWYAEQTGIARRAGVDLVDLPLEPDHPPSDEQVAQWLGLVTDPERQPVLVHCQFGVVRTGVMVAIYEMEVLGADSARALTHLPTFGHDFETPEREPIRRFILDYRPRLRDGSARRQPGGRQPATRQLPTPRVTPVTAPADDLPIPRS